MNTNKRVAQKVINRPTVIGTEFSIEDEKDEHKEEEKKKSKDHEAKLQALAKRSRSFNDLAEVLAQDKYFQRNHIWSKTAFPFNEKMQYVDKFFPYAEGGPLFVDEPQRTVTDLSIYEAKAEAMKALGHRYICIKPGMTELDAREALA